jgi:hypothetical protein
LKVVRISGVGGDFYMLYAKPASALSGGVGCAHRGEYAQIMLPRPDNAKPGVLLRETNTEGLV